MEAADYAWVVFAVVILLVLVAGWRIKDRADADLFATLHAVPPACEPLLATCGKVTRVGAIGP